jgi:predicted ester cyclase
LSPWSAPLFPDIHITIDDMLAEGDKVACRSTWRGTHKGEMRGIAPTGKQVTVTGIVISHGVGGKEVEVWESGDALGMLQQMGVIPTMEQG